MLSAAPLLDGYADDWPHGACGLGVVQEGRRAPLRHAHRRATSACCTCCSTCAIRAWYSSAGRQSSLDPPTFGDRVWLGFQNREGAEQQVFLAATGPGALTARRIEAGEYGRRTCGDRAAHPRRLAADADGYRVELRVPLSMLGSGFGVLVDDRDQRGAAPVSYGTLRPDDLHTLGTADRRRARADHLSRAVPAAGAEARGDDARPARCWRAPMRSRRSADLGAERRRCSRGCTGASSTVPGSGRRSSRRRRSTTAITPRVIGTLEVTQTAERLGAAARSRAHPHAELHARRPALIAVVGMFAFAAWLALRLSRLRRASESALTRTGTRDAPSPRPRARDELGDVARSFSTLLARLNEYTGYLRTLAGKLAHEIRTPLTIVRSSLDNLETEGRCPPGARTYLERARQGSERLSAILIAMGAATRVEEAIRQRRARAFRPGAADRCRRGGLPRRLSAAPFQRRAARRAGVARGAPRISSCRCSTSSSTTPWTSAPRARTITVRLQLEPAPPCSRSTTRAVPLPPQLHGRLFESLWQSRAGRRQPAAFWAGALHRAADRRVPRRGRPGPRTCPTGAACASRSGSRAEAACLGHPAPGVDKLRHGFFPGTGTI